MHLARRLACHAIQSPYCEEWWDCFHLLPSQLDHINWIWKTRGILDGKLYKGREWRIFLCLYRQAWIKGRRILKCVLSVGELCWRVNTLKNICLSSQAYSKTEISSCLIVVLEITHITDVPLLHLENNCRHFGSV